MKFKSLLIVLSLLTVSTSLFCADEGERITKDAAVAYTAEWLKYELPENMEIKYDTSEAAGPIMIALNEKLNTMYPGPYATVKKADVVKMILTMVKTKEEERLRSQGVDTYSLADKDLATVTAQSIIDDQKYDIDSDDIPYILKKSESYFYENQYYLDLIPLLIHEFAKSQSDSEKDDLGTPVICEHGHLTHESCYEGWQKGCPICRAGVHEFREGDTAVEDHTCAICQEEVEVGGDDEEKEDGAEEVTIKSYKKLYTDYEDLLSENKAGARPKAAKILSELKSKLHKDKDKPEIVHDVLYNVFNFTHGKTNEPNNKQKSLLLEEMIQGMHTMLSFLHR